MKDERYFALVELSLARMCEGGIYDHLGGGFSRYSVDERWLVPHFEKMLYDNALLLELLALVHVHSRNELFANRARETVTWLAREMTTAQGAFCASLDADSEGQEGKFYVWSQNEIVDVLGREDAEFFALHYDVTPKGNFDGHNILNRLKHVARSNEDEERLARMRAAIFLIREKRVRPGLDDKVLADWNGLMITALVRAGVMLGQPAWISMAERAFSFVASQMTRRTSSGERLGHSWREGKLLFPGLASDHAAMIAAALALYEATADHAFLDRGLAWQHSLDRHYINSESGGYFLSAEDAKDLVVRPSSTSDDAIPNPNAVAAENLVRLAICCDDEAWRTKADRVLEGILSRAHDNLFAHIALLNALDLRLRAAEIIVKGSDTQANDLFAAALRVPYLDRAVVRVSNTPATTPRASKPIRTELKAAGPGSAAFICVGETCSLPVLQPSAIAETITAMRA
jgi:uncharacterized protein YyaL (SSP411 family)